MDDRELDMWGPGIVLQPDNFGGQGENTGEDAPDGEDRFAERQDAVHRLNIGLAGADAEANELLSIVPTSGDYDFSAEMEKLFRKRSSETLKDLRHPADRDEAIQDFDELMRRYMGRAWEMSLDSRVRSRAAGAEQALSRIRAAAVADPDGLYDRLSDADMLLGRMVETGVDANAAATRARQFRGEVGAAILDDLAERDPRGAISRLDNGLFDGILGADDKEPIRADFLRIAEADQRAAQRRTALSERSAAFEAGARRRSTVAALTAALQANAADESAIERAFYRGEIGEDDARDLRMRLGEFDEERRRLDEEIDHLDTAIKSGMGIGNDQSFSQAWPRATVDAWWQGERNRETALPDLIPDCFGVTGCIPQPYLNGLRSRILSGLPDDAAAAGEEFSALRQRSPDASEAVLANLPEQEAGHLAALAHYAGLDLPPERMVEMAEAYDGADPRRDMTYGEVIRNRGHQSLGFESDLGPVPSEPVDLKEWYKKLRYDEDGNYEFMNTLMTPSSWPLMFPLRSESFDHAAAAQEANQLSIMEKDAFRHAYWSYKLSEAFGVDKAKEIGDAHERMSLQMEGSPKNRALGRNTGQLNPRGEGLMDLYNNHVGRQLYLETRDKLSVDVDALIMGALQSGRLQREPFNVRRRNQ